MAVPSDKDKKQMMDVAKPGETGANPTTRPIIVNHSGMMKDPMMAAHTQVEDTSVKTQKSDSVDAAPETEGPIKPASLPTHKIIQPITVDEAKPEEKDKVDQTPDESTGSSEDESTNAPESSDEAVVDAVIDQAGSRKKPGQLTPEEKKQQETVEKLVADKTYFVPISDTRTKRNGKIVLTLILTLILAVVGLAAAADAGVVNPGFKLPFDFIKDKSSQVAPVVTPAPKVTTPIAPKVTKFTNSQLGVSFSYPEAWGAATVTDNTKETTEKGKRSTIAFAQEPKVLIGLKTSAWKDSSRDVQRECTQPGFTTYVAEKSNLDLGIRVVSEKVNSQVYERLDGGLCSDLTMIGDVKFLKNTGYAGISVQYQNKVTDTLDLAQRIADYKKDYNKYFPETLRAQLIELTNSVQEL